MGAGVTDDAESSAGNTKLDGRCSVSWYLTISQLETHFHICDLEKVEEPGASSSSLPRVSRSFDSTIPEQHCSCYKTPDRASKTACQRD